ncbi:hypothetical protein LJC49_04430 [Ruminococcaceae bacterium OttesenSCG-928-I18]|nr:hypothetical protein [Ruminococcaceae bacterium OttesenSCG-928-I18]
MEERKKRALRDEEGRLEYIAFEDEIDFENYRRVRPEASWIEVAQGAEEALEDPFYDEIGRKNYRLDETGQIQKRTDEEKAKERGDGTTTEPLATSLFMSMAQTQMLDDVVIAQHPDLFVQWDEHWTGTSGSIVRDEGGLYRSLHDVGAGQNTKPSETPSMWAMISAPAEEWPVWRQPLGAHDAYQADAKVSHGGKHWINSYGDGNIWEPGVFGWSEE